MISPKNKCLPLLIILSFSSVLVAQEREKKEKSEKPTRHNIEVFNGITTKKGRSLYTLGIDYEYRLRNRIFALGFMTDYEFGHHNKRSELLLTPTFLLYPYRGFKLMVGGGVAFEMLTPQQKKDEYAKEDPPETLMLVRMGMAYDFEIGERMALAPTFNVDIDKELIAWVYGLGFTWEF